MKVICQKARVGECKDIWKGSCGHSEAHEAGDNCGSCPASPCVPSVPEYVRVIRGAFPSWYSDRIGEVFKVEARGEKCYRVYTGPKYDNSTLWWWVREEDCEPCEALYYGSHEHHVALNVEYQRKLKKGESTQDDYEDLRQCAIQLGNFHSDTPKRLFRLVTGMTEGNGDIPAHISELAQAMARYIDGERKIAPTENSYNNAMGRAYNAAWDKDRKSCEAPESEPFISRGVWHTEKPITGISLRTQKEPKMKYKRLKPISLELLWNAQPDKDCHEFSIEWTAFMNWFTTDVGDLRFGNTAGFFRSSWTEHAVVEFFAAMEKHDHGTTWLSYMEKHGFIEKESEPVTVTLQIKDEEDAKGLLRDLDKSCRVYLYYQLLDQLQSQGITP